MSINSVIRLRREALGLSQAELAARVSAIEGLVKPLSWQTIQQWEKTNGTAPKRSRLEHVAAALGISVQELIGASAKANVVQLESRSDAWPFRFDRDRFDRLDERDKGAVEQAALDMIERIEVMRSKRHGT